jgi:Flp pilus assembly protein TadG
MMLFGIVAFGLQFATRIALSYAVTEGGRAAVAGLSDTERESLATSAIGYALNAYSPLVDPDKATVSVTPVGATSNGEMLEISISYSDTRFANLPFVPDLSNLPPVSTTFIVADPSG